MDSDALSRAEVESLLASSAQSSAKEGAPAGPHWPKGAGRKAAKSSSSTAAATRPNAPRLSVRQTRALEVVHQRCGRDLAAGLAAMLRTVVEVRLADIAVATYGEFITRRDAPACVHVVRAAPLARPLALAASPAVVYTVVDRLLGGSGQGLPPARRPATEIELRLVARLAAVFLEAFRNAWKGIVDLECAVEKVESEWRGVQLVPPAESVVTIHFELTIGQVRGTMQLAIPLAAIEALGESMERAVTTDDSRRATGQLPGGGMTGNQSEVVARLAELRISREELARLEPGDVIPTEQKPGELIEVTVDGVPKFRAALGAFQGKKAVRIEEPIEPNRDETSND